jgi:hypothetical protein
MVIIDPRTRLLKGKIDKHWGKQTFESLHLTKVAILKAVERLKERDEW